MLTMDLELRMFELEMRIERYTLLPNMEKYLAIKLIIGLNLPTQKTI